jgi:predicted DNA-binding protein (UPF0278 family)
MTKNELIKRFSDLCSVKKCHIEGIYYNSRKDEIQNAIDCLECPDETLDEYMTVIKLKYPNTYRAIANNGDYKIHSYNRLHVYNTARLILS